MSDQSIPVCRDCGKPLDSIQQKRFSGGYITLWTCWEKTCLLNGVTLSPIQYNRLNDTDLEQYRAVNRQRLVQAG